jgi:carbonic anhydrase
MGANNNLSVSGIEALQKLIDGNKRFMTGKLALKDTGGTRRGNLVKGQKPFAVIIACSDSRVPPELIFDQALGDLFIVRTAGNVVDPIAVGSVEYAVEHLLAPLVVVMGHDYCGAVKAAVDGGEAPGSINTIIAKLMPSVEKAKATGATGHDLYELATDENIKKTVEELQESPIIKHFLEGKKITLKGAKYFLKTGEVVFD